MDVNDEALLGRRSRRRSRLRHPPLRSSSWSLVAALVVVPLVRRAIQPFRRCRWSYASIIRQQAADKHLDPALIAAVIYAETPLPTRAPRQREPRA